VAAATRVAVHYDVMYALARFAFMFYQYITECANCLEMLSFHVRALSVSPIAPGQSLNVTLEPFGALGIFKQLQRNFWG